MAPANSRVTSVRRRARRWWAEAAGIERGYTEARARAKSEGGSRPQ